MGSGQRASLSLTKSGVNLIEILFPEFNKHETLAVSDLSVTEQKELARLLRKVLQRIADET